VSRLEHLRSLIDLRRCQQHYYQTTMKMQPMSDSKLRTRIIINVSGTRYETFQSTLERYPDTLLGNQQHRALFYDRQSNEYFFDRHRSCFEAILYYYQSHGRLRRPDHVPMDTFLDEITFFELGVDALAQVRRDEELEEAQKVHLPSNRFYRHLWANLEYPQYSMAAKILNLFSIVLILLSAIELAVETLPKYRGTLDSRCRFDADGITDEMQETNSH
jgi:potassium voltage-gated channel Shaker-related subfamily A member 7